MTTAEREATAAGREEALARAAAERAHGATVSVGMAVAMGALAMAFAAVLLAYGFVRAQAPAWPPPGEPPPPGVWPWPAAATIAALAASAGARAARRDRRWLAGTAGAGAAFLIIQVAGWRHLVAGGVRPSAGIVASVVFALTIFHALHALAALIATVPALAQARARRYAGAPRSLESFWHLVTVAWLVVFVAVFVL